MTFAQVEGLRTDPAVAGASESYSLAIVAVYANLCSLRILRRHSSGCPERAPLLVSIALFLSLNNIHADAVFKHQVY